MLMHAIAPRRDEVLNVACAVRKLFTEDQETRRAFGGPPYTEDLVAELLNGRRFYGKILDMERKRIRLGHAIYSSGENAIAGTDPLAYIGISIVNQAPVLAYERKHVWGNRHPQTVDGIFIRRLVVRKNARRNGHARSLLKETLALANKLKKRLYCDTKSNNIAMRELAESVGGKANMFWLTPSKTLMVRYIWT